MKANVGWPLKARDHLDLVAPPTSREIDLLRNKLDPQKLFLG